MTNVPPSVSRNPAVAFGPSSRTSVHGRRVWTSTVCMYPLLQRERWRSQLGT